MVIGVRTLAVVVAAALAFSVVPASADIPPPRPGGEVPLPGPVMPPSTIKKPTPTPQPIPPTPAPQPVKTSSARYLIAAGFLALFGVFWWFFRRPPVSARTE